jgi:hypothetical protein
MDYVVWFEGQSPYIEPLLVAECQNISYEPENYDAYELRIGEADGQLYNNVTFYALSHGRGRCHR